MGQIAGYYFPEAVEEDLRVQAVRRYCLPERWFVPVSKVHGRIVKDPTTRRGWRRKRVAGAPRTPKCYPMPKKRPGLRFFPVRETPSTPVNVTDTIVELLERSPGYVEDVYEQAMATSNQRVLASLMEAMSRLSAETRGQVRTLLPHLPHNRYVGHLRAALA